MEEERINKISKTDVMWNYGATFLKIASSIILLPAILKEFTPDMVAIWSIFSSIGVLTNLLDFGFNSSFVRTITYIFSGSNELKAVGYNALSSKSNSINYGLLKGTINAMRWFYSRVAIALFLLLLFCGTTYIWYILENHNDIKVETLIAWIIFIFNNTFTLYTLYYEALMQGRGYIRESKKIIILAHIAYLTLAFILVFMGYGIISLVSAQVISIIIIRFLSKRSFFDEHLKMKLIQSQPVSNKEILKIVSPNALKMGLTQLGSFFTSKSSIFIGSIFLPLNLIAGYSITMQIYTCIYTVANIYVSTYIPKITQARVYRDNRLIVDIIKKSIGLSLFIYVCSTIVLCTLGPYALSMIKSKTMLLATSEIIVISIFSFLEMNHAVAGSILSTKNYIPFFLPSIYSGILTVLLLFIFLNFTTLGLWSLILAPGLSQLVYQNWKWPYEVFKDLKSSNW